MTYLFTKPGCERCDHIKAHADLSGISIQHLDNNPDALATLAYHELMGLAEKPGLPILFDETDGPVSNFNAVCDYFGIELPVLTDNCDGDLCQF